MRVTLSPILIMILAAILSAPPRCATAADRVTFGDTTFKDFSAGNLGASGANLYVARDGSIRTINRFDLNDDGHLDLIFNCTHDTYQMLPATVGAITRDGRTTSVELPVEGASRVVLGDLNRDGHPDAVFCPNGIGVHHPRRFLSIAWGAADGWSGRRITSALPMNGASDVAIVDLNHDDWPDVAVLGAVRWRLDQPAGRIVRVYQGSPRGFAATSFRDLGFAGAIAISSGDLDQDGAADLVVLGDRALTVAWSLSERQQLKVPCRQPLCVTSGDIDGDGRPDLAIGTGTGSLCLVRSRPKRAWEEPCVVAAVAASHIAVGRIDRDEAPDLVLTRFASAHAAGGEQAGAGQDSREAVTVLWGRPGADPASTFSMKRKTRLEVSSPVATAIGDINGDGHVDLAAAVHQGDKSFNGQSVAWLGDGNRGFESPGGGFATSGTTDVVIAPPSHAGGGGRVVFCNSIGGQLDERVPVHVFWGARDGFDPRRVWKIPFQSAYEASAADLNADGHTDLVLLNSGHSHSSGPGEEFLGANIFWGSERGWDLEKRRTVIHEHYLGTSSIADLNRDGWLDLVLEAFAADEPGQPDKLFVYYGSQGGFDRTRRTVISKPGYSQEHVIADVNEDGWLDVSHGSRTEHTIRTLWGGPQGFSVKRSHRLNLPGVLGMSVADLDADGQLDLFAGTYADPVSGVRDMGSRIFWGDRRKGLRQANSQWLPGFSPLGRTIADFDGDGHLDIFSPQHSGELTREDLACHIYWGSANGFRTRRRTTLICDSVNDSMAADFNGDGRIDLAVACHTRHGDHRAFSRVFYNDGRRFRDPAITLLPTNGTHLMWALDVGNVYDRSYRETFESRIHTWQGAFSKARVRVSAAVPDGARVELSVRFASGTDRLDNAKWRSLRGRKTSLLPTDRCLQYRATFLCDNGDRYPVLRQVTWELDN